MRLNRDHVRGAVTAIVWWAFVLCIWCLALALANVQACELQVMHGVPIYGSDVECSARTKFEGAKPDDVVVVPAGETVTLDRDATVLDVLVRGHLHIEPGVTLLFRTFTPAMGSTVSGHDFTLVKRDLPMDTEYDPQQWGHGVIVFGRVEWESPNWRDTHAVPFSKLLAGVSGIEFETLPHGWRVGDELVIPDTRQPDSEDDLGKQTELRTISAIDGTRVFLSEPLEFDHLGYGELVPDVGNTTQPIKFRNERPGQAVPGHIVHIGSGQLFLQGVDSEWGRTTTAEIDNSRKLEDGSWYIGKNQIARYGLFHAHHCYGKYGETRPWQGAVRHSVSRHSPKWGVSIHQSHWQLCEDVLVYDAAGCGIVTEEELSSNFKIHDCMVVAQQAGSGLRITSDHKGRGHRNDPTGDFWHNRGGLGLSSVMGEVTGNRLYCCTEPIGMAGAFGGPIVLYNPIERGVPLLSKTDANSRILASNMGYVDGEPKRYPFGDTSGNLVWGGLHGMELWNSDTYSDFPENECFPDTTFIHCKRPVLLFDARQNVGRGWKIYGDPSKLSSGAPESFAIDLKDDYRFGQEFIDCEIIGYDAAYRHVNDTRQTTFLRCKIGCRYAVYFATGPNTRFGGDIPRILSFDDCEWVGDVTFAAHANLDKLGPRTFDRVSQTFSRPWKDGYDWQFFHPIQIDRVAFGEQAPASVIQRADFGFMFGDDQTDCCAKVKILEARIRELEGQ